MLDIYNVCFLVQECVCTCGCDERRNGLQAAGGAGRGRRECEQQASWWRLNIVGHRRRRRRLLLRRLLHRLGLSLCLGRNGFFGRLHTGASLGGFVSHVVVRMFSPCV